MSSWDHYIGRSRQRVERVGHKDMCALASLLDYPLADTDTEQALPWPVGAMPPFAHWLNNNPLVRQSELGPDGHQQKGAFLPDIPLPRRMWAGSRVAAVADYAMEAPLTHRETIASIAEKTGRSGAMVFVTLQHDYFCEGELVLQEQHDRVYRDCSSQAAAAPVPLAEDALLAQQGFDWYRRIEPDPVLLFRYSAVAANSHRIHYDRDYATGVERYPGLVVHGPLTATLLIDLFCRNNPGRRISRFDFRSIGPLYDTTHFYIFGRCAGEGAELWALDCGGRLAMEMNVEVQ